MFGKTDGESLIGAIPRRRPEHFGQRHGSRIGHVVAVLCVGNEFAPELALSAEDSLAWSVSDRPGLARTGRTFSSGRSPPMALGSDRGGALVVIEVGVRGRCHDDVVAGLGGGDPPFLAPPAHHDGARRQPPWRISSQPTRRRPCGGQERVHLPDEPAMEFRLRP